jgi:hypothetical protein
LSEIITKASWAILALIHASPAATVFAPGMIKRLYGIDANGPLGVLLVHRGALFLAVVVVCLFAIFEPNARRAASLVTGISVVSFLAIYAQAGLPQGALRTVAIVDIVALVPLGWVVFMSLRHHAA